MRELSQLTNEDLEGVTVPTEINPAIIKREQRGVLVVSEELIVSLAEALEIANVKVTLEGPTPLSNPIEEEGEVTMKVDHYIGGADLGRESLIDILIER